MATRIMSLSSTYFMLAWRPHDIDHRRLKQEYQTAQAILSSCANYYQHQRCSYISHRGLEFARATSNVRWQNKAALFYHPGSR